MKVTELIKKIRRQEEKLMALKFDRGFQTSKKRAKRRKTMLKNYFESNGQTTILNAQCEQLNNLQLSDNLTLTISDTNKQKNECFTKVKSAQNEACNPFYLKQGTKRKNINSNFSENDFQDQPNLSSSMMTFSDWQSEQSLWNESEKLSLIDECSNQQLINKTSFVDTKSLDTNNSEACENQLNFNQQINY